MFVFFDNVLYFCNISTENIIFDFLENNHKKFKILTKTQSKVCNIVQ